MNYTHFRIVWHSNINNAENSGVWVDVNDVAVQELDQFVKELNERSTYFDYWVEYC